MMRKKCPQRKKNCVPSICFSPSKGNYICSGISDKPSKYPMDNVWLCLGGVFSKTELEMTYCEALGVISALTASLFGIKKLETEINGKGRRIKCSTKKK